MANKLTGAELVAYLESEQGLAATSLDDLCLGTGYYREITQEDGKVVKQFNHKPFLANVAVAGGRIAANIVMTRTTAPGGGVPGKRRQYRVRTNATSGNAVITGGYFEEAGIKPGDFIQIECVPDAKEIVLSLHSIQAEEADLADSPEEEEADDLVAA